MKSRRKEEVDKHDSPGRTFQTLKTLLFVRDHGQKITLHLQIMKSYVLMTHPQCLTALNQAYFPVFHLHQEKLLELMVKC